MEATAKDKIAELQKIVDDLKTTQLGQYVSQHKLKLLDSKFEVLDKLLDVGVLQ